jgi:hypothetical protein
MKRLLLLLFGGTFTIFCYAQEFEVVNRFCNDADSEFKLLLDRAPKERRVYWEAQHQQVDDAIAAKQKQLQETADYIGRQPDGEHLKGVYAFTYLNELNETELTTKTKLVEDLGKELFEEQVKVELSPFIERLNSQFALLQKKSAGVNIQNAYATFLEERRRVLNIGENLPIKISYTFEPKPYPFASPKKIVKFEVHDWFAAFDKVKKAKADFQPIEDAVESALLFTLKDPHPWITLLAQLGFLFIAIAASIKSYHGNAYKTIGLLAASSVLASIVLIFYSDETIWNIARQSLIPGGFMIYWIIKSQKKPTASPTVAGQ